MASTYLTRTPGSAGDRKKWTLSGWYKRSANAADYLLSSGQYSSTQLSQILFEGDDYFNVAFYSTGASLEGHLETNRKFRDPSAWYHIVVAMDTAQAGSSDRVKIYVNGVQQTSFKTETYPAQDYETSINNNVAQNIGRREGSGFYNGQMAHVHFCDGQAYAASDFGETDATSGMWIAKTSPSVTYGTNGFFLKYASGASGTDSSGNSNDFTVSGTMTNLKDSPDNNFATGNFLYSGYTYPTGATEGNGNTTWTGTTGWRGTYSTLGAASGKWYGEFKCASSAGANNCVAGFLNAATNEDISDAAVGQPASTAALTNAGVIMQDGSDRVSALTTYTTGDIVSCAIDITNGFMYWAVNGTWVNSGDPTSGATGTGGYAISNIATGGLYLFGVGGDGATSWNMNFGNGYFGTTAISTAGTSSSGDDSIWEYDCPTGYYGLNTNNLGSYS